MQINTPLNWANFVTQLTKHKGKHTLFKLTSALAKDFLHQLGRWFELGFRLQCPSSPSSTWPMVPARLSHQMSIISFINLADGSSSAFAPNVHHLFHQLGRWFELGFRPQCPSSPSSTWPMVRARLSPPMSIISFINLADGSSSAFAPNVHHLLHQLGRWFELGFRLQCPSSPSSTRPMVRARLLFLMSIISFINLDDGSSSAFAPNVHHLLHQLGRWFELGFRLQCPSSPSSTWPMVRARLSLPMSIISFINSADGSSSAFAPKVRTRLSPWTSISAVCFLEGFLPIFVASVQRFLGHR